MADERIHRAVPADGTEIVGRVHGQGPPPVLVRGTVSDDDTAWRWLLPHLTESFTCLTMGARGRGLSAAPAEPDYPPARFVGDVVACVVSVSEPVITVSTLLLTGAHTGDCCTRDTSARSSTPSAPRSHSQRSSPQRRHGPEARHRSSR